MEVGQKLLQSMKDIETAIGEVEGIRFRYNVLSISGTKHDATINDMQPLVDSLRKAGFVLDKKETTSYEVSLNFKHAELSNQHSVGVTYRPSTIDEIISLEDQKTKLETRIAKLKGTFQEV